jgi:hypothetical protein
MFWMLALATASVPGIGATGPGEQLDIYDVTEKHVAVRMVSWADHHVDSGYAGMEHRTPRSSWRCSTSPQARPGSGWSTRASETKASARRTRPPRRDWLRRRRPSPPPGSSSGESETRRLGFVRVPFPSPAKE